MNVGLVSLTQPVKRLVDKGIKTADDLVAWHARVSNPSNQLNTLTAPQLIKYLTKHKHWSPFEMTDMSVEIKTSRAIAAQILRHRSFSFQEFSQRYADVRDLDSEFVTREARLQDKKNRQNSIPCEDEEIRMAWEAKQLMIIHEAKMAYKWAILNGIAKEQARAVLPEGNTVSKLYVNGTIRSWIHYIELRSANGTQKEHIELAREIAIAIERIFPLVDEIINR